MSPPSARPQLLHVGDDRNLRASRSAILREAFDVIECNSHEAWHIFLAHRRIEGVVLCGSLRKSAHDELIDRLTALSPAPLIFQMADPRWRRVRQTLSLDPHSPAKLVPTILSALAAMHSSVPDRPSTAAET